MNERDFWEKVEVERERLYTLFRERRAVYRRTLDRRAWEGQPEDGRSAVLISVGASRPYLAFVKPLGRAAQLIVQGTFRLASADEVNTLTAVGEAQDFSLEKQEQAA